MTDRIETSQIPHQYSLCNNTQCNKANTCLHFLAERDFPDTMETCVYLNPKIVSQLTDGCKHYTSNTKVEYAKGMMNILNNMPHKQVKGFVRLVTNQFSGRTYYRMRSGERLITPHEQKQIRLMIQQCGVEAPQEFDEYILRYMW